MTLIEKIKEGEHSFSNEEERFRVVRNPEGRRSVLRIYSLDSIDKHIERAKRRLTKETVMIEKKIKQLKELRDQIANQ